MAPKKRPDKSRVAPFPKGVFTFLACLGILALIAASLQVSAPVSLSDKSWKNQSYKPGADLSKKTVMKLLGNVTDPEINLTVPELGLIYNMDIADNKVNLLMTLTAAGCPWSSQLLTDMRDALFTDPSVAGLNISLTFDPPWTVDRIDPAAMKRLRAEAAGTSRPAGSNVPPSLLAPQKK
ncbi:MAG: iron-sulfur cluster assembly protein [Desulfovibrio sp.]|jgi:metal-sulfur cluster biosynthetic enzyme|nr:iron-sulfur cluster assembly protein [Desulfovibrio sp.]